MEQLETNTQNAFSKKIKNSLDNLYRKAYLHYKDIDKEEDEISWFKSLDCVQYELPSSVMKTYPVNKHYYRNGEYRFSIIFETIWKNNTIDTKITLSILPFMKGRE